VDAARDNDAALIELPSHEAMLADPKELMRATLLLEKQVHDGTEWARQRVGDRAVVIAPPATPLTTAEMDRVYALPFARKAHPSYQLPIPAEEMIRDSVTSHRGCGGGLLVLHPGPAPGTTHRLAQPQFHPG